MADKQQQQSNEKQDAPKASEADPRRVRFFRVMEQIEVPAGTNGMALFKRGKVLSTKGYDVQDLMDLGVKLEEIPEPGWHRRVQERGMALRQKRGDKPERVLPPAPLPGRRLIDTEGYDAQGNRWGVVDRRE